MLPHWIMLEVIFRTNTSQAILTLLLAPGICYGSQSVFPFTVIIITMPPTQRKYLDVSPYASKSVDFLLMTLTLIFCVYSVFYSCWLLISILFFNFLRQGLSVVLEPLLELALFARLASNSQRSTCLCFWSVANLFLIQ